MPEQRVTVPRERWVEQVRSARADGYAFFDWLSAVDETDAATDPGMEVVARLVDPRPTPERDRRSMLLRTRVPEGEPLASLTGLFAGAAWCERETFEMFGVLFDGFDDGTGQGLRPLLLPEGFEGNPLRKSFVLASRATKPWPGGKEPGEGRSGAGSPSRRRVQAPGVPGPDWGREHGQGDGRE